MPSLACPAICLQLLLPRHTHLPELWLQVYGAQQCLARAARHPQREDCVEYRSCKLWWLYNIGVAQVRAAWACVWASGHSRIEQSSCKLCLSHRL